MKLPPLEDSVFAYFWRDYEPGRKPTRYFLAGRDLAAAGRLRKKGLLKRSNVDFVDNEWVISKRGILEAIARRKKIEPI